LGFHRPDGSLFASSGGAAGKKRPFCSAFPAASGASGPPGGDAPG
jgi:hypothetical protein